VRRKLNEMIEVFTSPPRFDYLNIRYFAFCNVRATKANKKALSVCQSIESEPGKRRLVQTRMFKRRLILSGG
jgi:hypothetical protein